MHSNQQRTRHQSLAASAALSWIGLYMFVTFISALERWFGYTVWYTTISKHKYADEHRNRTPLLLLHAKINENHIALHLYCLHTEHDIQKSEAQFYVFLSLYVHYLIIISYNVSRNSSWPHQSRTWCWHTRARPSWWGRQSMPDFHSLCRIPAAWACLPSQSTKGSIRACLSRHSLRSRRCRTEQTCASGGCTSYIRASRMQPT